MTDRAPIAAAAVLVLAVALGVDPGGYAPHGPLRLLVVSGAAFGGAAWSMARRERRPLHGSALAAWGAFGAVLTVAAATAIDPVHAWLGTPDRRFGWVTWTVCLAAFVLGQQLGAHRTVVCVTTLAAVGVGGYVALDAAGWAPVDVILPEGRIGGPFAQAGHLGATAVLWGPPAVGLAAARHAPRGWRLVGVAGGLAAVAALYASQSRGALVAAGATAVVVLVARRHDVARWGWAAVAVAGLGAVVVTAVSPVGGRLRYAVTGGGFEGRLAELRIGARVLRDHALTGVGPEGYRIAFTSAVDAEYTRVYGREVVVDRVPNGLLDVGATTGVVGLVAYGALLVVVAWAALRLVRSVDADADAVAVGLGAGLLGYIGQQQFLYPVAEVDPAFWLLAGVAVAATARHVRPGRRSVLSAAALLAVAAALAVVWGTADVLADRRLAAAVEAGERGDHAAALGAADRASRLRPDSIRARAVAAEVALATSTTEGLATVPDPRLETALDRLQRGLDRSPRDPGLRTRHSELLLEHARRSGDRVDLEVASAALEALVRDDPHHPVHHLRLGRSRALAGDLEAAVASFAAAEALAPWHPAPAAETAAALERLGDRSGARAAALRALALDPHDALANEVLDRLASTG